MLGEIERLMREVKGVCDNVAPDSRIPLTCVLAGLERIRRYAESTVDYAGSLNRPHEKIHSLFQAFGAILRIAEVESGARGAGFDAGDLSRITADFVGFYEPMAEQKGVMLGLANGASMPVLATSLLFEALTDVDDNALKSIPSGGRVDVRILVAGSRWQARSIRGVKFGGSSGNRVSGLRTIHEGVGRRG